jgi:hypothetical protein
LEILKRKEANSFGYSKAGCGELLNRLRLGQVGGAIDVYDAATLPEQAMYFGEQFVTARDTVEGVVEHDDIDSMDGCGRIVEADNKPGTLRYARATNGSSSRIATASDRLSSS